MGESGAGHGDDGGVCGVDDGEGGAGDEGQEEGVRRGGGRREG